MESDLQKDTDLLHEMTAREEEQRRAFVARDIERLDGMWSDDLLVNSPINRVHRKRLVLDLLRAGTIAHVSFDAQIDAVERQRDLVIVMGSETVVNTPGGPVIHRRFTNVWRAEDGTWRMILRHANIVPDPR
jgi:ketosteroid isomerase-like protein